MIYIKPNCFQLAVAIQNIFSNIDCNYIHFASPPPKKNRHYLNSYQCYCFQQNRTNCVPYKRAFAVCAQKNFRQKTVNFINLEIP